MKVNMRDMSKLYSSSIAMQNQTGQKNAGQKVKNGKFDQIQITRPSMKHMEEQFVSSMTKQIMKDVMNHNSEDKVEILKTQVQEGTYTFQASDIVSKILLEKGE